MGNFGDLRRGLCGRGGHVGFAGASFGSCGIRCRRGSPLLLILGSLLRCRDVVLGIIWRILSRSY